MDHREFLAKLQPGLIAYLSVRENMAALHRLTGHISLIVITGTLITLRVPFWPVFVPIHGVFLVFLFCLEHEATHKTPFASTRLNEGAGHLIGFIIVLPFQWFRYFHLAHHRFTNIEGKDPELLAGARPETWRGYLIHVSGLPYWASMTTQLWRNATGRAADDFLPKSALPRVRSESRRMLILYAVAATSLFFSTWLVWVWLVPLLLGQPFLRLFLLAEHGRCALVANMFENTRTTRTVAFIRFISWNMPYHVEHHTMPNVPYHNLPQLHALTSKHALISAPGYVEFTRSYVAVF